MNGFARFDWRAWRSAIADRLDRPSIAAGFALAAFLVAFSTLTAFGTLDLQRFLRTIAFNLTEVLVILAALAVAMVAVERGLSAWVAYAVVACIAALTAMVCGLVFDPNDFFKLTSPRWVAALYALGPTITLVPAVVYVIQSNATQSTNALRRLETERAAEAERLAHQRLQAQLATIDHDLVMAAMRLARAAPAQAETLLAAVSTYLRAAQQRESTDPQGVAAALAELRQMCAQRGEGPLRQAAA